MHNSYPSWVQDEPVLSHMNTNAIKVFTDRYLTKSESGKPTETIAQSMYRVSHHVAKGKKRRTKEFYELLSTFKFLPNTPTFTGAGTDLGQLAACFVLPVEDDMGSIFETLKTAALIQQSGGGVGFSFSNLRHRGAHVSRSNGEATGPVGFMRVYDAAFGEIAQGGTRRGANMAVLRVDHPDIYEFISCKDKEGDITNFNISVAITDKFMEAVGARHHMDSTFPLVDHEGNVVRYVWADKLFNDICKAATKNGEPGVLFIDRANVDNPMPKKYRLESTNPCGEQWLGPYENCCLGSINLAKHITTRHGGIEIDWQELQHTIYQARDFLNRVISRNEYIPSVPKIKAAALATRRIGLGVMGLADMFYMLGIRYGSNESFYLVTQLMEFIRFHAMYASIVGASHNGPFPEFSKSIYNEDWRLGKTDSDEGLFYGFNTSKWGERPHLDWNKIYLGLETWGIENATTLTVAPTGTLATVASLEGYGCEPAFALGYTRYLSEKDGKEELEYISPLFADACSRMAVSSVVIKNVMYDGSCQKIKHIPDGIREVFVVSQDLSPEDHVMMQSFIQMYVDNSISKTCNMPGYTRVEDVEEIFTLAWKRQTKGCTVYVDGSRKEVVLETDKTKSENTLTPGDEANPTSMGDTLCFTCPSCGYRDCGG